MENQANPNPETEPQTAAIKTTEEVPAEEVPATEAAHPEQYVTNIFYNTWNYIFGTSGKVEVTVKQEGKPVQPPY